LIILQGVTDAEEVLLRFSLKEAAYKAIHPIICQYVGFQEAEIKPLGDGSAEISLDFHSGEQRRIGKLTAHWRRVGDLFLSTASAEEAQGYSSQKHS
jgi:4'-phosphopantetheinyl transferase EntD